jgi:hypothetical protein
MNVHGQALAELAMETDEPIPKYHNVFIIVLVCVGLVLAMDDQGEHGDRQCIDPVEVIRKDHVPRRQANRTEECAWTQ